MPLYTFRCECGHKDAVFRKIDERNQAPDHCGKPMQRVIEAPTVQADLPGYQSPIDGRWVEGKRARIEDLKRSGCRPWEGMETERREAVKRAEEADRDFEKKTEAALYDTYNNMSVEKQKILSEAL
jgi:predicted nucleic acid-binding Zn ribbon protein